ncbi:hypothetical protein [Pseudomonas sp. SWRI99]|uniref:hypothetical protein n=1 Tax=Pseudomonas sp. SWRI99 TaxID=2745506 RepID=UPI001646E81C|nr:hypothetical protein [Pseudomonas sp. SWRI99]MBC3774947.1 hypothetical protein [Pseudomonas sp. SWRI99]
MPGPESWRPDTVAELTDFQRPVDWMLKDKIGKLTAVSQISPSSLSREDSIHCILDRQNPMCELILDINTEMPAFDIANVFIAITAEDSDIPLRKVFIAGCRVQRIAVGIRLGDSAFSAFSKAAVSFF